MHRSLPTECHAAQAPVAVGSGLGCGGRGPGRHGLFRHSAVQRAGAAENGPGVVTPFGRAPLSFADIVERVKPAVVSIQVSSGGPKVARNEPKGGAASRATSSTGAARAAARTCFPTCPTTIP